MTHIHTGCIPETILNKLKKQQQQKIAMRYLYKCNRNVSHHKEKKKKSNKLLCTLDTQHHLFLCMVSPKQIHNLHTQEETKFQYHLETSQQWNHHLWAELWEPPTDDVTEVKVCKLWHLKWCLLCLCVACIVFVQSALCSSCALFITAL